MANNQLFSHAHPRVTSNQILLAQAQSLALVVFFGFVLCLVSEARAESANKLEQMISPVTNPVLFEDPRSESSVRPIYMFNKLPGDFIAGSGDIQLWATEVRLAVNDRLAITAAKDGYIQINSDKVLDDSEGAANLQAGLKYAVLHDPDQGRILSLGLRYEWATGSPDVFQGQGEGLIGTYLSGAAALGDVNLMASTQLRTAVDGDDSSFWDFNLHLDYPTFDNKFYPLVDLNLVTVVDDGRRLPIDSEGFDLVSFGSSQSEGSTVVTAAIGWRYRICDWLDQGFAYQFPLTDREDIIAWRITTDLIIRFDSIEQLLKKG